MLPSDGVLNGMTVLYRCPAKVRGELNNLILVNNSADTEVTVNWYVNISGKLRPVSPVGVESLILKPGRMSVENVPLTLAEGNNLCAKASVDGLVTFVLCGKES